MTYYRPLHECGGVEGTPPERENMTTLSKPLRRETAVRRRDAGKLRPLVVTLHPGHMELQGKGTRRRLAVTYDAVYELACKLLARQVREEKRARKAGR